MRRGSPQDGNTDKIAFFFCPRIVVPPQACPRKAGISAQGVPFLDNSGENPYKIKNGSYISPKAVNVSAERLCPAMSA